MSVPCELLLLRRGTAWAGRQFVQLYGGRITLWCHRQVHAWISCEEVEWPNREVVPHDWHLRPIFWTRNVMEPNRVPGNNVRVLNAAVLLHPLRQAIIALTTQQIDTRCKEF